MKRSFMPTIVVLVAYVIAVIAFLPNPIRLLETKLFDVERESFGPRSEWPTTLYGVALDRRLLQRYGRPPAATWDRALLARLFDSIHDAGAAVILSDVVFEGATTPTSDAALAAAIRRDRVVLACAVQSVAASPDPARHAVVTSAATIALRGGWDGDDELPRPIAAQIEVPDPQFAGAALAVAHIAYWPDVDGTTRGRPPVLPIGESGRGIPSLALAGWMALHGATPSQIVWHPGRLELPGGARIALQPGGSYLVEPEGFERPFPRISAAEVLEPSDPDAVRSALAGRAVLVYYDLLGEDRMRTTQGDDVPAGVFSAWEMRLLEQGAAARRALRPFPMLALLLLALASASRLARATPGEPFAAAGVAIVGYGALLALLGRFADLWLPTLQPIAFLVLSAAGLSALSGRLQRGALVAAQARADASKAPTGIIALVFTDVQGSTDLWERHPEAMRAALTIHDRVLRERLERHRGYEVKTEGDAFMVVFPSALDAAGWCLEVQLALLDADWPAPVLAELPEEKDERGHRLWRGLRVRMGLHVGEPEARPDPKTGRMDYFGPPVNRAARVASSAAGGQIVLSAAAKQALDPQLERVPPHRLRLIGEKRLKGLSEPELLVELLPLTLAERRFEPRTGEWVA